MATRAAKVTKATKATGATGSVVASAGVCPGTAFESDLEGAAWLRQLRSSGVPGSRYGGRTKVKKT